MPVASGFGRRRCGGVFFVFGTAGWLSLTRAGSVNDQRATAQRRRGAFGCGGGRLLVPAEGGRYDLCYLTTDKGAKAEGGHLDVGADVPVCASRGGGIT